jgi:hypothetical protein
MGSGILEGGRMGIILDNRHHEARVPVYASAHFSFQNDDYKRSLRKIEVFDRKKTLASVNKQALNYHWLKGAADTYNISADIDDYFFCEIPSVTIGYPNRNLHCFPFEEVSFFDPRFGNFIYKTFVGKPVYADHCNKIPTDAKGIHFDAMLRKVPGWNVWKIYTLVGVDRTKDAVMAKQIERGERRSWSMGAWVSYFINACTGQISNSSTAVKYPKGSVHNGRLSYDICTGVEYFEQSSLPGGPADVTAESHQLWFF